MRIPEDLRPMRWGYPGWEDIDEDEEILKGEILEDLSYPGKIDVFDVKDDYVYFKHKGIFFRMEMFDYCECCGEAHRELQLTPDIKDRVARELEWVVEDLYYAYF